MTVRRLRELLKMLPPEAHLCVAVRSLMSTNTKGEIVEVREDRHGNIVLVVGPGCEEYDPNGNVSIDKRATDPRLPQPKEAK